jgi:hypothetical protein
MGERRPHAWTVGGASYTGVSGQPLKCVTDPWHYNGSAWTVRPINADITSMAGSNARNLWVTGVTGKPRCSGPVLSSRKTPQPGHCTGTAARGHRSPPPHPLQPPSPCSQGGGIYDVVKVPGTPASYWGAAAFTKNRNAVGCHPAIAVYGALP